LFLLEVEPGVLELQHQKSNLGPKLAPLRLEWPSGGVMRAAQTGGIVAAIQSRNDLKALLRLIHEYSGRGEFVHTAHNSPRGAGKLFAEEKTYPKGLKPTAVGALMRDAERDGLLVRQLYRDANRKPHERWALTPSGFASIGVAPSAPSAPSTPHGTP
jgi:hypothetical protein